MGLTRIRAEQINNIDYKQAVRVITLVNIALTGGAPAAVDGVNLSVGDRILVAGNNDARENGIYVVNILGSGSSGTWVRSNDTNQTGELEAGAIVMVTEGAIYADTQWKLTTNDPIIIGTSELTFEQNSAFAFGNIWANGTAVLANTVGDTLTLTPGTNIEIVGNIESKSVTIGVTGISLNSIANGSSNVTVVSSGGNVTVGIAGTQIANFSSAGIEITGNILGHGATLSGINAFGNIAVAGETTVSADSTSDTLTLVEGSGISIVTDAANNTITIGSAATDSIFATGGDMGTVEETVTSEEDLGLITSAATIEYDLGTIVVGGVLYPEQLVLPSFTVAELGGISTNPAGQMVFCSNESGGSVPAFSDGTNWRRVTDRQIVS